MAFSGMSSNGARGRGRWRGGASMSEMNVVPLVDVVLVLLIIFMVTASALEFGLEIEVPKTKSSSTTVEDAPMVSITKNGTFYLKDKPTNINVLVAEIRRQYKNPTFAYVRADRNLRVEQLLQIAAALSEAKLGVRLMTKPEDVRK